MDIQIKHIALLVNDYDEAIAFYTQKLNFNLIEDTPISEHQRWVLVGPKGTSNFSLLLSKASTEIDKRAIGNQAGGKVLFIMHTDNIDRDFNQYKKKGVTFVQDPKNQPYGKVAIFKDLYGNLWDLIEPSKNNYLD